MEQVEIEITGMAITHRYGTLKTGTVLRTDREYADHLVNDCGAAKYTSAAPAAETAPAPVVAAAPAAESAPAPVVAAVPADQKPAKSKK